MEQHKDFPNFWSALLVLGLLFGLQIILSIIAYDLGLFFEAGDPQASGLVSVLSCGVVFSFLMYYKKINYADVFNCSRNSFKNMVWILTGPILLTVGGAVFWISDLTNLIIFYYPMTEQDYLMFSRLVGGGVVSVIYVCVIAPFLEEMLFRGLLLRSFLHNYSHIKAIILSAALFALFHLNVYQLPVAFILGLFLGWLYVRTKSLWPCILGHSLYNTCTIVFWSISDSVDTYDGLAMEFNSLFINILAFTVSVFGFILLASLLKPKPVVNQKSHL